MKLSDHFLSPQAGLLTDWLAWVPAPFLAVDEPGIDVAALITLFVFFGLPVLLALFSLVAGMWIEKAHYKSIHAREAATAHIPVVPTRTADPAHTIDYTCLVTGSVVVSMNHFKRFLASLRKVFGGRIRSYESLVDRARREAILRMKEQAIGAHLILNLRLETSAIAVSERNGKKPGGIEVLAYGTAVWYSKPSE